MSTWPLTRSAPAGGSLLEGNRRRVDPLWLVTFWGALHQPVTVAV